MDEAIRQFLDHLRSQKQRSENTILAYKRDLSQFNAIIHRAGVRSEPNRIPVESMEYYLDWLTGQNYKPSTILRKAAAIRGFIEFWQSDEILPLHYIDNQVRDFQRERRLPHVLTREQITELWTAPMRLKSPLGLRDTAILYLMYEAGLRATDLIQLTVEDIDLSGKNVYLFSEGRRVKPMGDAAEHVDRYLKDGRPHLAGIPEERSLFLNQRGKGLSRQGVWFIVRRWADAAQLDEDVSPKTIRHSLVQHLMEAGLNNKDILRRLGLKSPNSLRAFKAMQRRVGGG